MNPQLDQMRQMLNENILHGLRSMGHGMPDAQMAPTFLPKGFPIFRIPDSLPPADFPISTMDYPKIPLDKAISNNMIKPGDVIRTNCDTTCNYVQGIVACVHDGNFWIAWPIACDGTEMDGSNCLNHNQGKNFHTSWEISTGSSAWIQILGQQHQAQTVDAFNGVYKPGMGIMDYVDKQIKRVTEPVKLKWLKTFRNCVLPEEVRCLIEEALTVVLCAHKFDEWGINEHFEKGLTNSILLYGPPGTGKTMIAESIAAVLDKNLMKLNNGDLQSQIPGQVERNITQAFEKAKQHNAVLMLDECDSILYDRDHVGMIIAAEINHLLGCIENFPGVVILTSNRLGKLDPALQRRIVAKIELGNPTEEARQQIWKNLLPPKMPVDKDVDCDDLAAHPLTGGEIKNAILLAARRAIARNAAKVTKDHFEGVITTILSTKKDYQKRRPRETSFAHSPVSEKVKTSGAPLFDYGGKQP